MDIILQRMQLCSFLLYYKIGIYVFRQHFMCSLVPISSCVHSSAVKHGVFLVVDFSYLYLVHTGTYLT